MAYKNLQDLVTEVLSIVGLVSGTAVQTYTEPQVKRAIQNQFDMIFMKRFWEWLSGWDTFTLSGSGGILNTNVTFKAYEDVKEIRISGTNRLVGRPAGREHLHVTGSTPLYFTPIRYGDSNFSTRVIKFWPVTATGDVDIYSRTKPDPFVQNTDIVPFPSHVIAQAAAWDLLDSDGINPPAAQKAQLLFDTSYQDLMTALSEGGIGLGSRTAHVPLTVRTLPS